MEKWKIINNKYHINILVLDIRKSDLKQKDLSLLFNVNIPTISMIKNRKTWTHI